jgi:hypothetical protein
MIDRQHNSTLIVTISKQVPIGRLFLIGLQDIVVALRDLDHYRVQRTRLHTAACGRGSLLTVVLLLMPYRNSELIFLLFLRSPAVSVCSLHLGPRGQSAAVHLPPSSQGQPIRAP